MKKQFCNQLIFTLHKREKEISLSIYQLGKKAEKETHSEGGRKNEERYGEVPFRIKLYAEHRKTWRFRILYISRKPH